MRAGSICRNLHDAFAELVRGGWIGTRTSSTNELTELVLDGLDAGRSVTVAAASGVDPARIPR
jgi:hypothetical protein